MKDKGDEHHALRAFAWSGDGRLIATGSENGTAQVWDAATGKLLWKSRVAAEYVAGVAFSHDGKFVAATAAPEDEEMRLVLLDAAGGALVREFRGMGGARFLTYYHDDRLLFSPDDRQLTIGDRRGVVTRWDVASGTLLGKKELDPGGAEARNPGSFVYARDLSFVAARCGKTTVLTDTETGVIQRSSLTG